MSTEADVDITDNEDRVFNLYVHKQGTYFANKVIPDIQASSLRHNPINYTREMTRLSNEHHPYMYMMDKDMLRSYVKDSETNNALAAILLLCADNRIMSVPPLHKTESIFRVLNENLAHEHSNLKKTIGKRCR